MCVCGESGTERDDNEDDTQIDGNKKRKRKFVENSTITEREW